MPRIITKDLDRQFKTLVREGAVGQSRELVYDQGEVKAKRLPRVTAQNSLVPRAGTFIRQAVISGTGADVDTTDPMIRNPLLNVINFYLPQRREILNQWLRYYDRFDPLVGNCLDLHATIPFSRFSFCNVDDPGILEFYEDMAEDMRLFGRILDISREFWLMGEVFPFVHWSTEKNAFDDMIILNPDYVEVRGVQQAGKDARVMELIPDPEIRQLIASQKVEDMMLAAKLDPDLVFAVENNMNIQLSDFNIEPIMRKQSPYDMRGTSILLRCLKPLLYKDKLREAQFSVAEGKITPYQIWKLGEPQADYMPTEDDLGDFRNLLKSAKGDFDFNIVTHSGLNVEFIGLEGKVMPIIPEMEFINKEVMSALFTNEAFVMGTGPTYSNSSVAMRVYQSRYDVFRDILIDYMIRKIFVPVAEANGFRKRSIADTVHNVRTTNKYVNERRQLILPEFKWEGKVNLVDDPQKIQFLIQLRQMKEIPLKPVIEEMGLDYEETLKLLDKEKYTDFNMQEVAQRTQPPMMGGGGYGGVPNTPAPTGGPGNIPEGPEGQIASEQRQEIEQFHREQVAIVKKN